MTILAVIASPLPAGVIASPNEVRAKQSPLAFRALAMTEWDCHGYFAASQ